MEDGEESVGLTYAGHEETEDGTHTGARYAGHDELGCAGLHACLHLER